MQSDELIWSVLNGQFCSFKVKTDTQKFCRNVHNVTGLCDRNSCPLANSRYATVREQEGGLYLYVKTIERAHSPKHMWEKIRLSNNYTKALEQIDRELIYWPTYQIHKCKQRLTKITQYLIKLKKLRQRENGKAVVKRPKLDKRETRREAKALTAARLEKSLEKELVSRLKSRAYGDAPLNVNENVWRAVLEAQEEAGEAEVDLDEEEEDYDEEEEEEREFVEDLEDESDLDDLEDVDDLADLLGSASDDDDDDDDGDEEAEGSDSEGEDQQQQPKKRKAGRAGGAQQRKKPRGGRKHVEVEYEMEGPARSTVANGARDW